MTLGQHHPVLENGPLATMCCDDLGRSAYALERAIFTAAAAVQ